MFLWQNVEMLVVHHLNNSRSQRILWLLEELGLPYDIQRYERQPLTLRAPDSLRKVHPLGRSPVVTDGDLVLAESGAILEYLVEKYGGGRLRPKSQSRDEIQFRFWMHFAEGSAMPPMLMRLIFDKVKQAPVPFFVKPIVNTIAATVDAQFTNPQLARNFEYMESELKKTGWFAGPEFSAADIQMSFPVEAADARGLLTNEHTTMKAWLGRIHERPAYKKALKVGGPYSLDY